MNLLLFSAEDRLTGDRIRLTGLRLRHLREVIRPAEGDSLRVGEVGGLTGTGKIVKLNADEALLDVTLEQAPPAKLPLQLVLALPRPNMLRRILRTVAELGVESLHLVNSHRVEKSYWQTPALEPPAVGDCFLQGLMQARDTVLPNLHMHRGFKPFVEDELPGLLSDRRGLVAHPGNFPPCPVGLDQPTVLVVGPEGGFIPYEVDKLMETGCRAVSLGPRILRVENAVTTLIARMGCPTP